MKTVSKDRIEPGMVVGVSRSLYEHYGVTSVGGKVIHYTSCRSDFGGDISVRETTFEQFMRNENVFWTMRFPAREETRRILAGRFSELAGVVGRRINNPICSCLADTGGVIVADTVLRDYAARSPEETLKRARSRLGEHRYNLATRNCEHFSFWCATGLATSQQVQGFLLGGTALLGAMFSVMPRSILPAPASAHGCSRWQPLFTRSSNKIYRRDLPNNASISERSLPVSRLRANDIMGPIPHTLYELLSRRENRA